MIAKESVGVYLISREKGYVLLQRRAETEEVEERIEKFQSNPFVCQPTFNGKSEPEESIADAIIREAREELGGEFADSYPFNDLVLFNVAEYLYKDKPIIGYNFVGLISENQFAKIKLHSGALPEFIRVRSYDLKKIKVYGEVDADPREDVVLFKDQYDALFQLFKLRQIMSHLDSA